MQVPDASGRFGEFGGRYVPETLTRALEELVEEYQKARKDPDFQAELDELLHRFVGRPSPCTMPSGSVVCSAELRFGSSERISITPVRTRSTIPSDKRCLRSE